MTLILQGTTKTKDLIIDYIEVQLSSGKTVSLNWDESGIDRTPEGFDAKYKGIYLNGEYPFVWRTKTRALICRWPLHNAMRHQG